VFIYGFLLWLFNHFELGIQIIFDPAQRHVSTLHLLLLFVVLGCVFWLLNSPIKSIIKVLSFPVNMLTLGLFSFVINVLIFYVFQWVTTTYVPGVEVILGTLLQTAILSFIMAIGSTILKKIL